MFLCTTCNQPKSNCNCNTTKTDNITYTGPNLPCTGIDTNDNITIVIQKLNDALCSTTTTTTNGVFGFAFTFSSPGTIDSLDSCNLDTPGLILYAATPGLVEGIVFYTNVNLTIPFNGQDLWYQVFPGNETYQIGIDGELITNLSCS